MPGLLRGLHKPSRGPSFGGCWGFLSEASPGWSTPPSLAFAQVAQGRRGLHPILQRGLLHSSTNVDLTFQQMSYTDTNIAF